MTDERTKEIEALQDQVASLTAALKHVLPYVYTGTHAGSERIRDKARDALSGGQAVLATVVSVAIAERVSRLRLEIVHSPWLGAVHAFAVSLPHVIAACDRVPGVAALASRMNDAWTQAAVETVTQYEESIREAERKAIRARVEALSVDGEALFREHVLSAIGGAP